MIVIAKFYDRPEFVKDGLKKIETTIMNISFMILFGGPGSAFVVMEYKNPELTRTISHFVSFFLNISVTKANILFSSVTSFFLFCDILIISLLGLIALVFLNCSLQGV